jgi:hypothetical protein
MGSGNSYVPLDLSYARGKEVGPPISIARRNRYGPLECKKEYVPATSSLII